MALTFVLVSSTSCYKKAAILTAGTSLSAVGLAVWRRVRAHEVVLLRSAGHRKRSRHPVCSRRGAASPQAASIRVAESRSSSRRMWRDGQPTLEGPSAITKWRQGVVYPGYSMLHVPSRFESETRLFTRGVLAQSLHKGMTMLDAKTIAMLQIEANQSAARRSGKSGARLLDDAENNVGNSVIFATSKPPSSFIHRSTRQKPSQDSQSYSEYQHRAKRYCCNDSSNPSRRSRRCRPNNRNNRFW